MANWNYTCKNGKAQRKELNEKMLEKMRKDKEKVLKLREKIDKAYAEIEKIKDKYEWTRYLGNNFDESATDEQKDEFYREFYKFFLEF